MKIILLVVVILTVCVFLMSVRIIFGRKGRRQFLHGHACRHNGEKQQRRQNNIGVKNIEI